MSLVMTPPPPTRHHLLTPAASLGRPNPHQKHGPPATLPISVPTRKSAHMPTSSNSRRNRDPSPDLLFEMSPSEDAPIHFATFAMPAPIPSIPSLPVASKNRLSLVDASLASTSRTAPIPVSSHQQEPFLYAFPVLSPAAKSAPQSLPSRGRLRTGDHLKSQPHTPSPPFGRTGGGQHPQTAPRQSIASSGPPIISAFGGGQSFDESDFDDHESYGGSPVATHWSAGRVGEVHPPVAPITSYRADVRQYELERGRARAPRHRGH